MTSNGFFGFEAHTRETNVTVRMDENIYKFFIFYGNKEKAIELMSILL